MSIESSHNARGSPATPAAHASHPRTEMPKNNPRRTEMHPNIKFTVRSQNMWVALPPQMRASINKSEHVSPLTPAPSYVNHS